MFRKAALTLFALAAVAFAAPSRPGGLTVSVNAPSALTSVDGMKVVVSVSNKGTEDVTIVNYGTVLDTRPTQSFTITKGGEEAKFVGLKLQLNMNGLDDSAYTTIKAGETVTVEHDVSSLYDFESLGEGAYTVTPLAQLPVVVSRAAGSAPSLTPFNFEATPSAEVQLTGDVARRSLMGMDEDKVKRATVSCSNSSQASFISASYTEGKSLASIASSYIASNGANSLYTAYWKTNSQSSVRAVFNGVASENTAARTLGCSDPYAVCNGNVIAYTVISGSRPIYYCSIFYNEVASSRLCSGTTVASRNVRGGTTLHELTHAVSGTTDVGYGCAFDQGLSAADQLRNADNYNCFATQVYQNTQC